MNTTHKFINHDGKQSVVVTYFEDGRKQYVEIPLKRRPIREAVKRIIRRLVDLIIGPDQILSGPQFGALTR